MSLTSNTLGQTYAFTVLTPIRVGAEDALGAVLARFAEDSPFAALGRTHFARWVVVNDLINEPSQPTEDHLACHYLLFTATLDGCKVTGSVFAECVVRPLTVIGGAWQSVRLRRHNLTGVMGSFQRQHALAHQVEDPRAIQVVPENLVEFLRQLDGG